MNLDTIIKTGVSKAVETLFGSAPSDNQIQLQKTRPEFEGDITLVVFPFVKMAKNSPENTAKLLGEYLEKELDIVSEFNVVKGFLNLTISNDYWLSFFNDFINDERAGLPALNSKPTVVVEYSSPNTNKPLHLGHLRNNFLGWSVAEILKENGHDTKKVQIINDRGIHICKSMIAWQKFGEGETPSSSGLKGDKLVGKYYVKFDQAYKSEIADLMAKGKTEEEAKKEAPILLEAQEMLRQWEAKEATVYQLWETMNGWVYNGFEATYKAMGVDFDKLYYESETYLKGKDIVLDGLEKGLFFKKEDGSIWADLTAEKLDEKLLLRGDGTSVYMTQDIGTAIERSKDFPEMAQMIYTVGNEQEYHFKVLFTLLKKMGMDWAKDCYHLSYGMVELPHGKMKSREGTVVDADDLMENMAQTARDITEELGKLDGMEEGNKNTLFNMIGQAALKYFLLKVDPKKNMMFNPEESVDFNGNTGPFIQYTHARIQSLIRKYDSTLKTNFTYNTFNETEKNLIKKLAEYPDIINDAATAHSPAIIANYTYDLVKQYNSFYQSNSVLKADSQDEIDFRVALSSKTGNIVKRSMRILGIDVPDKM